jgi:PAS domain S-box-containing protein
VQDSARTTDQIDLQPALEQILRNAVRAVGGSAAVAATWDEVGRHYVVTSSYGIDSRELARLRPLLDEAIPDLAGSQEQFDLISELDPHRTLPVSQQGQLQNPIMALPLRVGSNTIGLIFVMRSMDAATFSNLDPPALSAFAEQAAIAVQNARLAHLLAQEKRRIESILEGSADGIYTVDPQRRVVGLNGAMERLLGCSKDEIINQLCSRALNARDWEGRPLCPDRCPLLMPPGGTGSVVEMEGKIQSQDGRSTDVTLVYSIIRSPEGQPLNAVVNVRDISRTREMENLRSAFLSMLGHQLQTPLAIIKGYANTLARSDGHWDEATLRQSVEAIEEETDRLSQLMNRLLLASRLETGEMVLRQEPVRLEALADKVVRRSQAMTSQHTFSLEFPANFPTISADPALLEEALINLVDNAIKYSPQGGVISIKGKVDFPGVAVTIADQGIGIPWWETRRIFERFHRGQDSLTQRTRGLGLGLYICHAIVTAHGGSIEVTSELGKGSQFTIILPIE